MIDPTILNRKGARKAGDIPGEVMALLKDGLIETANLTEWLAIDQGALVAHIFPQIGLGPCVERALDRLKALKKPTAMASVRQVGHALYDYGAANGQLSTIYEALASHPADTVRGYAAYLPALDIRLGLAEKLGQVKPLAADHHFGVREIVWMALRPSIADSLAEGIALLVPWTASDDANTRRFTTEATRPRGVWCQHIEPLKDNPEQALPILEPLRADPAKYVQDSVGNWLNDASKTQPGFVRDLCARWTVESSLPATQKIVKRALRSIDK